MENENKGLYAGSDRADREPLTSEPQCRLSRSGDTDRTQRNDARHRPASEGVAGIAATMRTPGLPGGYVMPVTQGSERRGESRIRMLTLVEIDFRNGELAAGIVYNIGHRGMFIVSGAVARLPTCVDIALSVAGGLSLEFPAVVVHQREYGF